MILPNANSETASWLHFHWQFSLLNCLYLLHVVSTQYPKFKNVNGLKKKSYSMLSDALTQLEVAKMET